MYVLLANELFDHDYNQRNKRFEWQPGVINKQIGPMIYEINLADGQLCKRHQNQLRLRQEPDSQLFDLQSLPDDLLNRTKLPIQVECPGQQ